MGTVVFTYTFTSTLSEMEVDIPYMEHLWVSQMTSGSKLLFDEILVDLGDNFR